MAWLSSIRVRRRRLSAFRATILPSKCPVSLHLFNRKHRLVRLKAIRPSLKAPIKLKLVVKCEEKLLATLIRPLAITLSLSVSKLGLVLMGAVVAGVLVSELKLLFTKAPLLNTNGTAGATSDLL